MPSICPSRILVRHLSQVTKILPTRNQNRPWHNKQLPNPKARTRTSLTQTGASPALGLLKAPRAGGGAHPSRPIEAGLDGASTRPRCHLHTNLYHLRHSSRPIEAGLDGASTRPRCHLHTKLYHVRPSFSIIKCQVPESLMSGIDAITMTFDATCKRPRSGFDGLKVAST